MNEDLCFATLTEMIDPGTSPVTFRFFQQWKELKSGLQGGKGGCHCVGGQSCIRARGALSRTGSDPLWLDSTKSESRPGIGSGLLERGAGRWVGGAEFCHRNHYRKGQDLLTEDFPAAKPLLHHPY